MNELAELIDHCRENYDGCQNLLSLVGQTVWRSDQCMKGTAFETEEVVSEEMFGMKEVKHAWKQHSINQMS